MFREMRRSDRLLPAEEAERILSACHDGILSVLGEDGYPYGVPVNYGYQDGKIYIHGTSGPSHKADAIAKNGKVCFTVVEKSELELAALSTRYASVIVFGTARLLKTDAEKEAALRRMMRGIAPELEEHALTHCSDMSSIVMIEITPDHVTAKGRA